jgi:hypothetical protein
LASAPAQRRSRSSSAVTLMVSPCAFGVSPPRTGPGAERGRVTASVLVLRPSRRGELPTVPRSLECGGGVGDRRSQQFRYRMTCDQQLPGSEWKRERVADLENVEHKRAASANTATSAAPRHPPLHKSVGDMISIAVANGPSPASPKRSAAVHSNTDNA